MYKVVAAETSEGVSEMKDALERGGQSQMGSQHRRRRGHVKSTVQRRVKKRHASATASKRNTFCFEEMVQPKNYPKAITGQAGKA